MSDRIHQLEDGLQDLQSSCSTEPHPLLCSDLRRIKSSAELHRIQAAGATPASSPGTEEIHENDAQKSSPLLSFHSSTDGQSYDQNPPTHVSGYVFVIKLSSMVYMTIELSWHNMHGLTLFFRTHICNNRKEVHWKITAIPEVLSSPQKYLR